MKTKNTFAFSLAHAMKKNFIMPILTFIGLFGVLIINFSSYTREISVAKETALLTGQNFRELLRGYFFRYVLFSNYNDTLYFLTSIGVIGASALLGILLFRFVSNKKTVNVYYSLGITRTKLYCARYLAGIIMLFAAITVPFLIMALINIYYFGSSVMLWKAVLFFIIHFCVIAFASFSIAAAVSGSVGTIVEAIGFSAIIILSTSIIMVCVTDAIPFMLFGAPKNTTIALYNAGNIYQTYNNSHLSSETFLLSNTFLGRILENIDLIFLNRGNIFSGGLCIIGQVVDETTFNVWAMPPLTPYILWAIGSVAFFALGLFMFKYKKAEICGFMGRNKVLNFIISAILSFLAFCGVICMLGSEINTTSGFTFSFNMWNRALIGIVISFLVFSVIELLLTRSFKSYKRNIKFSLIHIGLMVLFVFSLHLGFFGYSSYIPDIEDIKSVNISTPSTLTGAKSAILYSSYSDFYWIENNLTDTVPGCYYTSDTGGYMLSEFKDKESIQSVIDFHQKLIDEGWVHRESDKARLDYSKRSVKVNATIVYTLKDGRQIARGYQRLPLDLYEEMFRVEDTDKWNGLVEMEFTNFLSGISVPVIFSEQMDKKTFVDENLINGLGQAIIKDIKALDYTSFWRSDADWLGCVAFFNNPENDGMVFYYDDYEDDGYEAVYQPEFSNDADYYIKTISERWQYSNGAEYTALMNDNSIVPITSEMKNTIAFLQSNGLYEALIDESEIVSARVIDAAKATASRSWNETDIIFNAFWDNGKAKAEKGYDKYGYYEERYTSGDYMPDESVTVTDKKLLKELQNNAYGMYLDTDGGYIVEFKRANGNTTIMFVPSGRISQEIK
ncbi:MAG: hypothetical protein IJF40_00500 [Clostridia bacterium]|nr:hypothetical protein [Clostridia bacterium]MBQ7046649.1 hypothetical protein [Oscillospiraceae bacterium]